MHFLRMKHALMFGILIVASLIAMGCVSQKKMPVIMSYESRMQLFNSEISEMMERGGNAYVVFKSYDRFVQFIYSDGKIVLDVPSTQLDEQSEQALMQVLGDGAQKVSYGDMYSIQYVCSSPSEAAEKTERIFKEVYGNLDAYKITAVCTESKSMPRGAC